MANLFTMFLLKPPSQPPWKLTLRFSYTRPKNLCWSVSVFLDHNFCNHGYCTMTTPAICNTHVPYSYLLWSFLCYPSLIPSYILDHVCLLNLSFTLSFIPWCGLTISFLLMSCPDSFLCFYVCYVVSLIIWLSHVCSCILSFLFSFFFYFCI